MCTTFFGTVLLLAPLAFAVKIKSGEEIERAEGALATAESVLEGWGLASQTSRTLLALLQEGDFAFRETGAPKFLEVNNTTPGSETMGSLLRRLRLVSRRRLGGSSGGGTTDLSPHDNANHSARGQKVKHKVIAFFAFDTTLPVAKRRIVLRRSMEELQKSFFDGKHGRKGVAWRFFSDDELPDNIGVVQQPKDNRKPVDAMPSRYWVRRWLYDVQWGMENYHFKWLVRADDDGVLCPRNFAKLTEGLKTIQGEDDEDNEDKMDDATALSRNKTGSAISFGRNILRRTAKTSSYSSYMDSWTANALRKLKEDLPRSVIALSAPCGVSNCSDGQFKCMPSAYEQYSRELRMFETKVIDDENRYGYYFTGGWEENWALMSPEFIEDLSSKVSSDGKCWPQPEEHLPDFFQRLQMGTCSSRKWPGETTIVNIGRRDRDNGGLSTWGHSVWDSSVNKVYGKYHTLKEFHMSCVVNSMVWFHHVDGRWLNDVHLPESMQWINGMPQNKVSKPTPKP